MPSRMRPPEEVRLELEYDDDWIVVKKHLTAGETKAMRTRVVKKMIAGHEMEFDYAQVQTTTVVEYLLDWSLLDAAGQPIVIRDKPAEVKMAAIDALPQDKFDEIFKVVERHVEAMRELVAAEKKTRTGVTALSPTSVSVE